jgi:hypothetical protein
MLELHDQGYGQWLHKEKDVLVTPCDECDKGRVKLLARLELLRDGLVKVLDSLRKNHKFFAVR